ncbi:CDP-diacylglycerol--serine O-phosphatidyltransferase [Acidobacteria bacterium ACD]|nr:MAG: CDP-diacylglycerol--serine O-phosphatidyltransferase [Acidobacteriota bacterium]MCE7960648.1 CDP-diacylglycerol--serine O-phosphatidyltransferase [Acidobacteria bacterium ACB2]MDL1952126.1 CDP-diacylglycerol--serine O-phosphatidyltransferase [Acidobacteria bacterium ACD]
MKSEPVPHPRRGVRRGVYVLPALLTLGNIFCGWLSLEAAVKDQFHLAASLLFLAGILDGLDGRVARLAHATSAFGEQLDSLSDVISFGLAPAFLVYRWGLGGFGRGGLLVAFLFLVCGACRLARFNAQLGTTDKRYFVGLPIPGGAAVLVGTVWVHPQPIASHALKTAFLVMTLVVAYLMVSTFRYRSFKDVDLRSRRSFRLLPVFGLVIAAIAYKPEVTLTAMAFVFAASAPVARLVAFVSPRRGSPPPPAAPEPA